MAAKKPPHSAKGTTVKTDKRRLSSGGRNERRYKRYRTFVGKPNGPGESGNKSGKNKRRSA